MSAGWSDLMSFYYLFSFCLRLKVVIDGVEHLSSILSCSLCLHRVVYVLWMVQNRIKHHFMILIVYDFSPYLPTT